MLRKIRFSCCLLLILLLPTVHALDRTLLYPTEVSGKLEEVVKNIQTQAVMPYENLPQPSGYYVRIAPQGYILTENNQIADSAILGTKPFVFITTPEGIYGKTLLDIYLDIGYEAEDIIRWQRDVETVAIVFRYSEAVSLSAVTNGEFPADWDKKVFVPTWDNILTLFKKLAEKATVEPDKKGEFAPTQLFFKSEAERHLVLGFPPEGQQRLKTTDYNVLRLTGGADSVYRDLLERKLSVFEHFRGTGRTLNEVVDPKMAQSHSGLLEFVAPNQKVKELPEVAIISLGKLVVENR